MEEHFALWLPTGNALLDALITADLDRAAALLAAGADINGRVGGDTLLSDLIHIGVMAADGTFGDRLPVVRFMLAHGADPRLLNDDGNGPLFAAAVVMETEVIRLLLDNGADLNRERDSDGEPLYDWAEFDYRHEVFGTRLPEPSTEDDRVSEEAWIAYLDRMAVTYGKRRPDHLILLRSRGALTWKERDALKDPSSS